MIKKSRKKINENGLIEPWSKMGKGKSEYEKGYIGYIKGLQKSTIPYVVQLGVFLATAEFNGCKLSLAEFLQRRYLAGALNRNLSQKMSEKEEKMAEAAVEFTLKMLGSKTNIKKKDVTDLIHAGFDNREIVDLCGHLNWSDFITKHANSFVVFEEL
jgi:hypothetical protein